jgi:uncharacterized membrane protein
MPERPRSEPEIIPPGADDGRRDNIWGRYEDSYGVHRIYIARPGLPSILIGLFILGSIVALVFLVVVGALLLAFPLVIAGILLALFYGPVRYHWRRLRGWLGG